MSTSAARSARLAELRATYIAGLRAVADLLESTPQLPLPSVAEFDWSAGAEVIYGRAQDEREGMARLARLIPGTLAKNDPAAGHYDERYFELAGNVGGMPVRVWATRETVCERVVVGTKPVTRLVPPPGTRLVEVTEDVEVVEWQCRSLLAQTPATAEPPPVPQADGHPDPLPPVAGPGEPETAGAR